MKINVKKSRELLLVMKSAEKWAKEFEGSIDDLMQLFSKLDTLKVTIQSSEVLDIYRKKPLTKTMSQRQLTKEAKPFEFLVFNN